MKRYDEALEVFNYILTIYPNHHDIWFKKSYTLNKLERFDEALVAIEKVLQLKSKQRRALKANKQIKENIEKKNTLTIKAINIKDQAF